MKTKKKQSRPFSIKKLILLAIILLLPLAIIEFFNFAPSIFSVSVKTELLKFETIDDNNSKIPLYNVKVLKSYNDTIYQKKRFDGTFKIADSTITNIERIGNGDVFIRIESLHGNKSVGTFYSIYDDEIKDPAGDFIQFYIDDAERRVNNGETMIIPITGIVTIGRSINYESHGNSTAIVRSGKVTVIGKSLGFNNYFKSEGYDLNIGDQFIVKNPKGKAYGFVTINENIGMTANYKIMGDSGRIITPGPIDDNSGYNISTTFKDRLEKDKTVKIVSLMFAILASIATIWPLFKEISTNTSRKSKKKK